MKSRIYDYQSLLDNLYKAKDELVAKYYYEYFQGFITWNEYHNKEMAIRIAAFDRAGKLVR